MMSKKLTLRFEHKSWKKVVGEGGTSGPLLDGEKEVGQVHIHDDYVEVEVFDPEYAKIMQDQIAAYNAKDIGMN